MAFHLHVNCWETTIIELREKVHAVYSPVDNQRRRVMRPLNTMAEEFTLTLSEEERSVLLRFLEQALRDKQIEEHRTDAFNFKEFVGHQVALLRGLIHKLNQS